MAGGSPGSGTDAFHRNQLRIQALENSSPFGFCLDVLGKAHLFRDQYVSIGVQRFQQSELWLILVHILQHDQPFLRNPETLLQCLDWIYYMMQGEDQKYGIKVVTLERQALA